MKEKFQAWYCFINSGGTDEHAEEVLPCDTGEELFVSVEGRQCAVTDEHDDAVEKVLQSSIPDWWLGGNVKKRSAGGHYYYYIVQAPKSV